ncbi:MAG TPA: hypothetical protein VNA20_14395 [Frankiaceae bacterium]|nr:hypothetical protein [Frankiaceae bacterium]
MTPDEFRTRATLAVAPVDPDPATYAWLREQAAHRRFPVLPVTAGAAVAVAVAVGTVAATAPGAPGTSVRPLASTSATATPTASPTPSAKSEDWRGDGTSRETFLPMLERAQADVTWPDRYVQTPEFLWAKVEVLARDSWFTEEDARFFTRFGALCSWTVQLVDDEGDAASTRATLRALDRLAARHPDLRDMTGRITTRARRGDFGHARQFVFANGCAKGFER